jgi:hypothetical protein
VPRCLTPDASAVYIYIFIHIQVSSLVGFRGVRPDPDETPDDRQQKTDWFWVILDRVIK